MYRVERKYLCSDYEMQVLRQRLEAVLPKDSHQERESYTVRSLYFDTYEDEYFYENENGVDDRKKYRIRIYPDSDEKIAFETKLKRRQKCRKESFLLTRTECERIIREGYEPGAGDLFPEAGETPVRNRIALLRKTRLLHPVVIVEYERSAFVYPVGNVRVTFDRNIVAAPYTGDFFEGNFTRIPVLPEHMHALEVRCVASGFYCAASGSW